MNDCLKENFSLRFGCQPAAVFSAPGRTELGGNHTDHQHGLALASAVDLCTKAAVKPNDSSLIRIVSEGYAPFSIDLKETDAKPQEAGTTAALVRGLAAGLLAKSALADTSARGFDAYISSTVLPGSGLSSSAAFEILLGTVMNELWGTGLSTVELARLGQYAENVYFGKPCGMLDQLACSEGRVCLLDFEDPEQPRITPVDFSLEGSGYRLYMIDSGADHAGLTAEYAAVPAELAAVCRCFGKNVLREVPEEEFEEKLPAVLRAAGSRAALRAMHIYEENRRVRKEVEALNDGRFEDFLGLVQASGSSSWRLLQNVAVCGSSYHQELAFALAFAEKQLDGRGACRVHGGGFAGVLQAYVPEDMAEDFVCRMEHVLCPGCCHRLQLRREGGIREE